MQHLTFTFLALDPRAKIVLVYTRLSNVVLDRKPKRG
jgi:hypothetical protein